MKRTAQMDNVPSSASVRGSETTLLTAALLDHRMMQSTRYLSQSAAQGLMICCESATFTRLYVKGRLIEVRTAANRI